MSTSPIARTTVTNVLAGTEQGQTLRWDTGAVQWQANSDLIVDDSGNVSTNQTASGDFSINGVAGPTSILRFKVGGVQRDYIWSEAARLSVNATGSRNIIYGLDDGAHIWYTQLSTERMRIDSAGNVGIGTAAPVKQLHIDQFSTPIPALTSDLLAVFSRNSTAGISIIGNSANTSTLYFGDNDSGSVGRVQYSHADNSMGFWTGAVERGRFDASGNLLVGTTAAGARLHAKAAINTSAGDALRIENSTPISVLRVRADAAFYAQGIYNFTSGGAANVVAGSDGQCYRSTSSIRYKTDVQDAPWALSDVLALRPVTYRSNTDHATDKRYGGLIAEEVHAAGLTEFVQYNDKDEPDALDYGNMVSLLVKAIQELTARVEALEA